MIRTILTPKNKEVLLSIPDDYVGKEIEVLLYSTDEIKEKEQNSKGVSHLRGKLKLSPEQYQDFQHYVKISREEWSRNI
jgi:hypothetical protein